MFCEVYKSESEKIEKEKPLVDRLLEHFSEDISENTEDFAINIALKDSRYIFVKRVKGKKIKRYFAYCTHCKEEYEIDEYTAEEVFHHNNSCQCPKCRSKCTAKHERYRRSTLKDYATFITYQKSKIDPNTVVAKGYFVARDYTGDYKDIETQYFDLSRFVFKVGESYMLTKGWSSNWYLRDRCCSYKDGCGDYRSYVDIESIKRAIRGTELSYSPYEIYLQEDHSPYNYVNDMTLFFYKYCKYPIVEKLVKSGFKLIADCIVKDYSLERSVNFRQTDLFKFLGINRAEAKEIINSGYKCNPSFLNIYKFAKKEKLGWDISKINNSARYYGVNTLKEIKKYSGINKVLTYFDKQEINEKDKYYFTNWSNIWFDYLKDCKKLEYNLRDKSILFPKNLEKAHQKTIKLIKYKADKELDEDIKKTAKKIEKLKFEYKDLIIRPATTSEELIKEGEKLSHCVGGYTRRYAKGETYILFIRNKNNPDKPYYTIEISRKYTIVQVRGKSNKPANEEVKNFIDVYKKEVLEKLTKKNKKVA